MTTELETVGAVMPTMVDPMLPQLARIDRVRRETHDTFTLEFNNPCDADEGGARFAPGQFNMLYVHGVGEVPISISSDPAQHERLQHTTREVGTVTRAMRRLKVGDLIGVRGPLGRGWPVETARGRDVVLVAGGIGLAPLRPLLYELIARRSEYGKVVLAVWHAHTRGHPVSGGNWSAGVRGGISTPTSRWTAPRATGAGTWVWSAH